MRVLRTYARVYTSDLDAALTELTIAGLAQSDHHRFRLPDAGVEVCIVGDHVVVAGDDDALAPFRDTSVTWVVDDIEQAVADLAPRTVSVVRPVREVPTGRNATLELTGMQVELVEWTSPSG